MIEYDIGDEGQTLVLSDCVLQHLMHHCQKGADTREAGGQLFASFHGRMVVIERATGPRRSDRRSRMAFVPNRVAERAEIKRLFKQGLHFVGDWHTHAEPRPKPSVTDINSFREMFQKSHHNLAGFVMIIVGSAPLISDLFVGIVDGANWKKLQPSSVLEG